MRTISRQLFVLAAVCCVLAGVMFIGSPVGASGTGVGDDAATAALAARVVILANADDEGSLQVARHYAEQRHVPPENIIALPMPHDETITWKTFVDQVWEPLLGELTTRKWIDVLGAESPEHRDDVGRTWRVVTGHRIAYLVVCRGVPLRIAHNPALYREYPPFTDRAQYRTNQGAVDAELSAIPFGNYPINACLINPLFAQLNPTTMQQARVIKVARLDGPDVASAMALVDHAIEAEKQGSTSKITRAYVDIGGGPSSQGDEWLKRAAQELERAGVDVTVDRAPSTFPADTPFEEPAYYFGWYAEKVNGPFLRAGFKFPPGAVALHIHSFSAASLRSSNEGWCGAFVARGVTATFGNVYEPFLNLTHQPHMLAAAFLRGERAGDAAYYAMPALSWQEVFIGDPLFRKPALANPRRE